MDDEIQTWWEIPSIVHFCKVFTLITKDISRIDINEFENAVEENSYLLTDMAIRFTQICVSYDPNTNEWWNIMKELFRSKCIIYNFKYSLDSATYFDDLTRKQKVEALYIFCNFILDVKDIQNKLSNSPNICHMLNVTPLGYDLNKSVYWYFGTNKLYREDFENSFDLSTNFPVKYYSNRIIQHAPYPSGVFGSGKWNTICNNIDDWHSLADITKYSKNIIIRYLHKAISDIIINLPKVKKNKSYYAYLKPLKRSLRSMDVMNAECKNLIANSSVIQRKQYSQNVKKNQTKHRYDSSVSQINETSNPNVHDKPLKRSLRSMDVMNAECKNLITNSSVIQCKQYSRNVKKNQTKHRYDSSVSQINETSNLNVHDRNQNISYSTNVFNNNIQIGTLSNKLALKLGLRSRSKNVLDKWAKKNIVFDKVLCIKLDRCDREK